MSGERELPTLRIKIISLFVGFTMGQAPKQTRRSSMSLVLNNPSGPILPLNCDAPGPRQLERLSQNSVSIISGGPCSFHHSSRSHRLGGSETRAPPFWMDELGSVSRETLPGGESGLQEAERGHAQLPTAFSHGADKNLDKLSGGQEIF